MVAGAVNLRKTHDIVILSFCNIVKGQATYLENFYSSVLNMRKVNANVF